MLTLDFVSRRYGVLPSYLLEHGSSIDVQIADIAQTYINKKEQEQIEYAKTGQKPTKHNLSQDDMLAMIERVKQKKND